MKKSSGPAPSPRPPVFRASRAAVAGLLLLLSARGLEAQTVRVLDPAGKPVAGARVEAIAPLRGSDLLSRLLPPLFSVDTDEEGKTGARLPAVEGILLLVDEARYLPWTDEVGPKGFQGTVRLSTGSSWDGRVGFSGKAPASGTACASWEDEFPRWATRRAWRRCSPLTSEGRFALRGLPDRPVTLEVEAPGFLPLKTRLKPGEQVPLRLIPGILLRGRVVGLDGRPIAAARARAAEGGSAESGEGGDFALAVKALPASLTVGAAGFHAETVTVAKLPKPPGLRVQLRPPEQLSGTIAAGDGKPVPEADLRIERLLDAGGSEWEHQAVKSPEGAFRIELPGPGTYRLAVRAPGFREETPPPVTVSPGQAVALGVIHLSEGSKVVGALVDPRGKPVSGVAVEVLPMGTSLLDDLRNRVAARAVSGEDGSFTVRGLGSGRYELRGRREGFATAASRFTLAAGDTEDLGTLVLEPGTTLRGRLTDRAGNPRPGLTLRLFDPEQSALLPIAEQRTGEDGAFRGPTLAAGRYRLQVTGNRLLLSEEIEVPPGPGELGLDRTLGGVRLQGLITRSGQPGAGGFVSLSQALDPGQFRGKLLLRAPDSDRPEGFGLPETVLMADVGPDGAFELADVPPGLAWVTYTAPDGPARTRRLTIPDQERFAAVVEIGGVSLQGRVEDARTELGVEASLQLSDPSGRTLARTVTEADGAFALPGLEPGRYNLQASADGFTAASLAAIEVSDASPPLRIRLEPGEPGRLTVRLHRPDGSPASGILATLLDASGVMVRSLPTDAAGERRFENLSAGAYFLVWSDAVAGAGVSQPLRLDGREPAPFDLVLPEGAPVQLTCDPAACGGAAVDFLGVYSAEGLELGPYLSGASSALRFSREGGLGLGRLSPGRYLLRLWLRGVKLEAPLAVEHQSIVTVPLPFH
ncbi:MAG: collagen binding domain-containing protein [Thermoanaerobaculia bacterium]